MHRFISRFKRIKRDPSDGFVYADVNREPEDKECPSCGVYAVEYGPVIICGWHGVLLWGGIWICSNCAGVRTMKMDSSYPDLSSEVCIIRGEE